MQCASLLALAPDSLRMIGALLHGAERAALRIACKRLREVIHATTVPPRDCYLYCIEHQYAALLRYLAPPWPTCNDQKYTMYRRAAASGSLAMVRLLYERERTLESVTCAYAAWHGHMQILRYAHEHAFQCDSMTCSAAALGGHLDCLRYLHDNGCSWDAKTRSYAAAGGHLDCLRYLHERGCAWDLTRVPARLKTATSRVCATHASTAARGTTR